MVPHTLASEQLQVSQAHAPLETEDNREGQRDELLRSPSPLEWSGVVSESVAHPKREAVTLSPV
jgi:hypothetical protein